MKTQLYVQRVIVDSHNHSTKPLSIENFQNPKNTWSKKGPSKTLRRIRIRTEKTDERHIQ